MCGGEYGVCGGEYGVCGGEYGVCGGEYGVCGGECVHLLARRAHAHLLLGGEVMSSKARRVRPLPVAAVGRAYKRPRRRRRAQARRVVTDEVALLEHGATVVVPNKIVLAIDLPRSWVAFGGEALDRRVPAEVAIVMAGAGWALGHVQVAGGRDQVGLARVCVLSLSI